MEQGRFLVYIKYVVYTGCPKNNKINFKKQIGKSLPLDNYSVDDDVSAGNKSFNFKWSFLNNHVRRHIPWSWKRC